MTEKICDILDDMAQNGFIDSDISHKHIDHIMGIIWMIRMICQHMRQGAYDGEAVIYGHAEVIALLRELSEKLIQKKDVAMIGQRLHLVPVEDGASKEKWYTI